MRYIIGGIKLEIIPEIDIDLNLYNEFIVPFEGSPDINIRICQISHLVIEEKEALLDDCYLWYRNRQGGTSVYMPDINGRAVCKLETDSKWKNINIYCTDVSRLMQTAISEHFIYSILRIAVLFNDGIFLHSSSFVWKGMGIAATAPSGTGKSTFTAWWEKYYDAEVINDDCPLIRLIDGVPHICGNPWSGSSMKFQNMCVPLFALIVLEQAEENKFSVLNKKDAVDSILPRFILPYYDDKLMISALDIINKIIGNTKVFKLSCRPEREAADIVAAHLCK